jgi:hypothetical protein
MDAALITGLVAVRLYWSHKEPVPDVREVWNAGAILVVVGLLYAPLRTFLGYPLAGVAVTLWLGNRFSTMPRQWLKVAARNLTGFTLILGILMIVTPASTAPAWATVVFNPVLVLLTLNHLYKLLAERSPSKTLAPQYVGLAAVLFALAYGVGSLQWIPNVPRNDTWLLLTADIARWTVAVTLLGTVNQIIAELRGGQDKVTGLLPFWTIAFGLLGGALATYSLGLIEMGDVHPLADGFRQLQRIAQYTVAVGLVFYMIGLWRRRVRLGSLQKG